MKSKKLLFSLSMLVGICTYLILGSNSSGMMGAASTGCGGGGCHSANPNTTIALLGVPVTGFVPGTVYNLTVSVSNSSKVAAGFDLEVSGGIISGAPAGTMLMGGTELHHTSPKAMLSGIASWSFNWTAPTTGTSVTFNIAGNAVDNLGSSANDAWSVKTENYSAATTTVTPPSVISSMITSVTQNNAGISGSVNANGGSTSVSIDYGLTTSYGSNQVTSPGTVIGTTPSAVTATLSGLTAGTVYHYRIKATNSAGTTNGPDATFTTLPSSVNNISESNYTIYPNPTYGNLILKSPSAIKSIQVSAFTLQGSRCNVSSESLGANEIKINTLALAQGYYVLNLAIDGVNYQHTFIKQ